MSGDADLIKLYSQRILALSADIPHQAPLESPQATAKKRSPLCGSTVSVALSLEDGKISEYSQDVKACALGQSSASVLGSAVIGLGRDQIQRGRGQSGSVAKPDYMESVRVKGG